MRYIWQHLIPKYGNHIQTQSVTNVKHSKNDFFKARWPVVELL